MHPVDRFLRHVVIAGPDDCWLWTGALNNGYGHFNGYYGRTVGAHRFAYEMWVGDIPNGMELDHLCNNPPCVNPAHLEPVTSAENTRRGDAGKYPRQPRTHCIYGHPFSGDNLYIRPDTGSQQCRTCTRKRAGWQGGPNNRDKTHCHRGHSLSGDNLRIERNGRRTCRTCERARRIAA